ncbi:hypothetical protein OROGR_005928 [Orobanche gracilis]
MAARVISCALPSIAALPSKLPSPQRPLHFYKTTSYLKIGSIYGRRYNNSCIVHPFRGKNCNVTEAAARREYRKVRSRRVAAAKKSKEKELELSV